MNVLNDIINEIYLEAIQTEYPMSDERWNAVNELGKYIKGNVRARKRVDMVKQALRNAGYDENKVHMDFLSSVDSHKFVNIVNEMKHLIED